MQTKKQVNQVLSHKKGGPHHKDMKWCKERIRQQDFNQIMIDSIK